MLKHCCFLHSRWVLYENQRQMQGRKIHPQVRWLQTALQTATAIAVKNANIYNQTRQNSSTYSSIIL